MWVFIIIQGQVSKLSGIKTCYPDQNQLMYEELDCKAVSGKENCTSSYYCDFLFKNDKKKCYYKRKEYSIRQTLLTRNEGSCYPVCTCQNFTGQVQFFCSKMQCREQAIYERNRLKNCLFTYSNNSCCADKEYCGVNKVKAMEELPRCVYKNVTRYKGQYIKESCRRCLCDENFNNATFDPMKCEREPCEIEKTSGYSVRNYCAPVYLKAKDCCPTFWYCSDGKEKIITNKKIKKFTDQKCKFGKLSLGANQILDITGHHFSMNCIKCSCITPPFLTCTLKDNCHYNSAKGFIHDKSLQNATSDHNSTTPKEYENYENYHLYN